MADITNAINDFKTAVSGEAVRDSFVATINLVNDDNVRIVNVIENVDLPAVAAAAEVATTKAAQAAISATQAATSASSVDSKVASAQTAATQAAASATNAATSASTAIRGVNVNDNSYGRNKRIYGGLITWQLYRDW